MDAHRRVVAHHRNGDGEEIKHVHGVVRLEARSVPSRDEANLGSQ